MGKSAWSLVLILAIGTSVMAQQLPFQLTWRGVPIEKSFGKAAALTIVSYEAERDLKRGRHPQRDTLTFDSAGRNTMWMRWNDWGRNRNCWQYDPSGCPVLISCDGNYPENQPGYTCRDGVIDSLLGMLIVTDMTWSVGKCTKEMRYQRDPASGDIIPFDSILHTYDGQGRLLRSETSRFSEVYRYLGDTIVIKHFSRNAGTWRREIRCGKHGLPLESRTYTPDNRRKKEVLSFYSKYEWVLRE